MDDKPRKKSVRKPKINRWPKNQGGTYMPELPNYQFDNEPTPRQTGKDNPRHEVND